jgi:hypothetical protein
VNVVTIVVYEDGSGQHLFYQHSCPLDAARDIVKDALAWIEQDIAARDNDAATRLAA